jgi:hypothetical protein
MIMQAIARKYYPDKKNVGECDEWNLTTLTIQVIVVVGKVFQNKGNGNCNGLQN